MTGYRKPLRSRIGQWLKEQAKFQIIVPVAIAVGLLAYVMSVAVAPRSATQLWAVLQQTWLVVLILTVPYLAARAYVWRELLLQSGFHIPWRQLLAAFAAGEMTKSLPAGVYTQNYILGRLNHFSTVSAIRSGAATTAMLGLETLLAVPVVAALGVPGQEWVRWTILAVAAAWVVLILLIWALTHFWDTHLSPYHHPWLHKGAHLAAEFIDAGRDLIGRKTVIAIIPTAIYMLIYVVDLHLILRALGINSLTFANLLVVYCSVVLAVILVPIPTEIGITEFTGLSALLAFGVPGSTAAVAMLSLRLLATGLTIVLAGVLLFLMRAELQQTQKAGPSDTAGGAAVASR